MVLLRAEPSGGVTKSFGRSTGFLECAALKGMMMGLQDAVSPDKAAVLLLLARNECVGVRSLLTTLLSQGLSCRRRALSGEFSKVADEEESRLLMTGSTCFERFMVETERLSGSPLWMLELPWRGLPQDQRLDFCLGFWLLSIVRRTTASWRSLSSSSLCLRFSSTAALLRSSFSRWSSSFFFLASRCLS